MRSIGCSHAGLPPTPTENSASSNDSSCRVSSGVASAGMPAGGTFATATRGRPSRRYSTATKSRNASTPSRRTAGLCGSSIRARSLRVGCRDAHELEVHRVVVVHDEQSVLAAGDDVLDVVLDAVLARPDHGELARRVGGVEQPGLARDVRAAPRSSRNRRLRVRPTPSQNRSSGSWNTETSSDASACRPRGARSCRAATTRRRSHRRGSARSGRTPHPLRCPRSRRRMRGRCRRSRGAGSCTARRPRGRSRRASSCRRRSRRSCRASRSRGPRPRGCRRAAPARRGSPRSRHPSTSSADASGSTGGSQSSGAAMGARQWMPYCCPSTVRV